MMAAPARRGTLWGGLRGLNADFDVINTVADQCVNGEGVCARETALGMAFGWDLGAQSGFSERGDGRCGWLR